MGTAGFRMVIEDVFSITGRPFPIALGRRVGDVSLGESLKLIRPNGISQTVYVRLIELVCRPGTRPDPALTSLGLGDGLAAGDFHPGDVLESA